MPALPGVDRTEADLSAGAGRQVVADIWGHAQRGLVYPSPAALFVAFTVPDHGAVTTAALGAVVADARAEIHARLGGAHTSVVLAVGFDLWRSLAAADGSAVPLGLAAATGDPFRHPGTAFADTGIDLWFHVKSDDATHCEALGTWLRTRIEQEEGWADPGRTRLQAAATKSQRPDKRGGKVLGSRFSENLNNATDPLTIQQQAVVGFDDPAHLGASYVLAQRFAINWDMVLSMSPQQVEDLVGRSSAGDTLIPSADEHSHIKRARAQDADGNTTAVMRLSLPFGRSAAVDRADLRALGASRGDEEGLHFAGYARSPEVLETIMARQNGEVAGAMADRLLANVRSDLGGLLYVPSLPDLGLDPNEPVDDDRPLERHPGIDWTRLDRHFDQASRNGLMHYNHKEYLFRMTTLSPEERTRLQPPSHRVLSLLADTFSRWQDTWYFDRAQQEMPTLGALVTELEGPERAAEVMALSIEERSGWAHKLLLGHVVVDPDYGFRGRRTRANGDVVNGADTFHIHPAEILVGAMPNLGLGSGKYLVDFARDDEQMTNFFDDLSYASGVGHVVPTFTRALADGIGALIADAEDRAARSAGDEPRRRFHAGTVLALEGVRDHCRAYAALAEDMAGRMGPGQAAERDNLTTIAERMRHLATEPPRTMVEAAQLVFTLHSCLHHVGEPTAVGRLDQLLQPFLDADAAAGRLDAERAQEVIDCFWVKLGQKVLLNRRFVEDHQVFGNLAMGGASAPYPQGSSINQWIQQVTVGGTVADDAPGAGTPAYGDVTIMCLRAARRLPLNAPCLSLRTRDDMPEEILREAALAQLSGGAHPILLADEKVIPGLVASGEDVGAGASVAERSGGRWDSTVALRDARDYACDGCYEPQLSGRSWFTLGGVVTTAPLEAALNQGKTWQTAGPTWFRGTRVSFTSRPAQEIESFDDLVDLYFEHLRWMYAKQVDGQIGLFGRMNDVCPAPLLSVLVDGCQDKGLDYYEGGPRYNVIAPCLTGLSTLIDSLWAIRALVFEPTTARTSLPELVDALRCDWGEHMVEPFVSVLEGPARIEARAERFRRLRADAMALPRYGHGRPDIDAFGDAVIGRVARTAVEVFTEPVARTAEKMVALAERLGTADMPFGGFQIQPGVGTFENYLDWGGATGASADGRRSGDPLASDLSPSPSFGDLPIDHRESPFAPMLAGFGGPGVEAMWDAAPVDVNIGEDFPVDALTSVLRQFASGKGSSVLTVTCADPETYAAAAQDPERYDLLRVRMGGWTEFFVGMFPAHQAQHARRPFQTPGDGPVGGAAARTGATSTRSGIYRSDCDDGREIALSRDETFPPCGTHGTVGWTLVRATNREAGLRRCRG